MVNDEILLTNNIVQLQLIPGSAQIVARLNSTETNAQLCSHASTLRIPEAVIGFFYNSWTTSDGLNPNYTTSMLLFPITHLMWLERSLQGRKHIQ